VESTHTIRIGGERNSRPASLRKSDADSRHTSMEGDQKMEKCLCLFHPDYTHCILLGVLFMYWKTNCNKETKWENGKK